MADTPSTDTTPATIVPVTPPKPAIRTTQFWLLVGVLALIAAAVFDDKIPGAWLAFMGPLTALIYQITRETLYRDAATHPNDTLDNILATVMGSLHEPKGEDAQKVIEAVRALFGNAATAPIALPPPAGIKDVPITEDVPTTMARPSGSESGEADAAFALFLGAIVIVTLAALFAITGCSQSQQTPYYISGVTANVDTSKDGARLSGGSVGVSFSPNPYYPLPAQKGLAK